MTVREAQMGFLTRLLQSTRRLGITLIPASGVFLTGCGVLALMECDPPQPKEYREAFWTVSTGDGWTRMPLLPPYEIVSNFCEFDDDIFFVNMRDEEETPLQYWHTNAKSAHISPVAFAVLPAEKVILLQTEGEAPPVVIAFISEEQHESLKMSYKHQWNTQYSSAIFRLKTVEEYRELLDALDVIVAPEMRGYWEVWGEFSGPTREFTNKNWRPLHWFPDDIKDLWAERQKLAKCR